MKAIVVHEFGGPNVLRYEDVPDPTPGPGQVVVSVRAIGVNPVDAYVRTGTYAANVPVLPYTPGTDAAGVVKIVGEGVTAFKPGDRVYTGSRAKGAYAEKLVTNVENVYPLPEKVSFEQGAALGVPAATAYRALVLRGQPRAGETLLVHGATGGVGLATVQIARSLGLTVFGTAGTPEGAQTAREAGAHHVFNHRESGYLDKAKAATPNNGAGFDLIVEMLANVNLGRDLTVLAPRGRVIVVGSRGAVEIDARNTMGRDADIRGMSLNNATPDELKTIHAALRALLENGILRPLVGKTFPLAEATAAQQEVMSSEGHVPGKILLIP